MHSNLLLQAFQKAQDTISSNKPTHLSRHLSDFILEDSHEPFGEKSLRNYYKRIFEGDEVCLKPYVVQSLCHYLGYASYEAYIVNIPKKKKVVPITGKHETSSQFFSVVFMVFFFVAYIFSFRRQQKPLGEILRDCQTDLEHHFYRMERLMRYMQGGAA